MVASRQPVQITLSIAGVRRLNELSDTWHRSRVSIMRAMLALVLNDPELLERARASLQRPIPDETRLRNVDSGTGNGTDGTLSVRSHEHTASVSD